MVQSANAFCDQVYFVRSGSIAICEPTAFQEPILVYGKGSVVNMYQVIMDEPLNLSFYAVCDESYQISKNSSGRLEINYAQEVP